MDRIGRWSYRNAFLATIAFTILAVLQLPGQDRRSILKVGGFPYFLEGSINGYSLHAEYELALGKTPLFSMGPRFEYIDLQGPPLLTIGYQLKYYPLAKHAGRRMQGPVIGLEAAYLLMDQARTYSRYGPGLGLIVGYQHRFRKRLSLSFEASPVYMVDLNEKSRKGNAEGRYWYAFMCIKAGISF